jgi:hypothetical protein
MTLYRVTRLILVSHNNSSVRFIKLLAADAQMTLRATRPLEQRLVEWHRALPTELKMSWLHPGQLNTNAALHVAYLATRMVLHRATFRPFHGAESTNPMHAPARSAALESAKDFLVVLDDLRPEHLQGFWYSCTHHSPPLFPTRDRPLTCFA